MKYQVISYSREWAGSYPNNKCCIIWFSILAETKDWKLAERLRDYWDSKDSDSKFEIHAIMDSDEEIVEFLKKHK